MQTRAARLKTNKSPSRSTHANRPLRRSREQHMKVAKDLTGMKFDMLVVEGKDTQIHCGRYRWICRCDCGSVVRVAGFSLTSGNTKSCGCKKKTHPHALRHGMSDTRIHQIWVAMRKRCSPKCPKHARPFYYDKGISVCEQWQQFENFFEWALLNGYRDDLSIDRIDGDKGYSPDNCRWATQRQQNNNKSSNRIIAHNGDTKTLEQWAAAIGIGASGLHARFARGWSTEKALSTPPRGKKT
jgi:hypothetical protein